MLALWDALIALFLPDAEAAWSARYGAWLLTQVEAECP